MPGRTKDRLPAFLGPPAKLRMAAAPADTPGKTLTFPLQTQARSHWCWAATTASVATYYAQRGQGAAKDQCRIAADYLPNVNCAQPRDYDAAGDDNQPQALDAPLADIHHLNPPPRMPVPDFQAIADEIDHERPICCRLGAGSGHFVVICGYRIVGGIKEVILADPDPLKKFDGPRPYWSLQTPSGGSWDVTYFTQ